MKFHPESKSNENFDPLFCEMMVAFRARNRMSQKDLSVATGLSLATIINAETGRRGPSKTTKVKILDVIAKESEEGEQDK